MKFGSNLGAMAKAVQMVACGRSHTLALTRGGDIWAWGDNEQGQCGTALTGGDKVQYCYRFTTCVLMSFTTVCLDSACGFLASQHQTLIQFRFFDVLCLCWEGRWCAFERDGEKKEADPGRDAGTETTTRFTKQMVSPCPKQCGQCGWESLRATDSIAGRVRGCERGGGGGGKLAFHVFDQPWHRVEGVRLGTGGGGSIGERHGGYTCGERIETKGVQCLERRCRAVVVRPSYTQHQLRGSELRRRLEPRHVVHVGRFEFGEMRGETAGGEWSRVAWWFQNSSVLSGSFFFF